MLFEFEEHDESTEAANEVGRTDLSSLIILKRENGVEDNGNGKVRQPCIKRYLTVPDVLWLTCRALGLSKVR